MEKRPFTNTQEDQDKNLAEIRDFALKLDLSKDSDRRQVRKELRDNAEGQWSILEDILLDIEVGLRTQLLAEQIDRLPSIMERVELLKQEISSRFSDDPKMVEILTSVIPTKQGVTKWVKRARWKAEVDHRMKDQTLFSPEKRAAVINKLYQMAVIDGNNKSAELWLKMAGELDQSKGDVKDTAKESYNNKLEALWKKQNQ